MADLRRAAVVLAVALPFLLGAAAGTDTPDPSIEFRFQDGDIVESSGLALVDDVVVTTNDSGDTGRVFAVDPRSGETVGTTRWSSDPVDVEALAPAGPGHVWVGDIGDNQGVRDSVSVARVPVGRGDRVVDPTTYTLTHPGGARDAETLLAHPFTGRLYVVTKGVFAGQVMEVPHPLLPSRTHRLRPVARAPGIVTDGAFLPGGGAAVLRTYTRAVVVAFPSWQVVTSWDLPPQQQGEGVTVDGADLLISSEGVGSAVLRLPLPPEAIEADVRGSALWALLRWLAVASGTPAGAGQV